MGGFAGEVESLIRVSLGDECHQSMCEGSMTNIDCAFEGSKRTMFAGGDEGFDDSEDIHAAGLCDPFQGILLFVLLEKGKSHGVVAFFSKGEQHQCLLQAGNGNVSR